MVNASDGIACRRESPLSRFQPPEYDDDDLPLTKSMDAMSGFKTNERKMVNLAVIIGRNTGETTSILSTFMMKQYTITIASSVQQFTNLNDACKILPYSYYLHT